MPGGVVTVILDGRPIGDIERLATGELQLHFHDPHVADPHATLLSVSMPPTQLNHGDGRITPWLWGVLAGAQIRLAPFCTTSRPTCPTTTARGTR